APHDDATRGHAAAVLARVYPGGAGGAAGLSPDEVDGVLLVASWFRRHAAERQRRMTPQEATAAPAGERREADHSPGLRAGRAAPRAIIAGARSPDCKGPSCC